MNNNLNKYQIFISSDKLIKKKEYQEKFKVFEKTFQSSLPVIHYTKRFRSFLFMCKQKYNLFNIKKSK